jgi:hypothetical protein
LRGALAPVMNMLRFPVADGARLRRPAAPATVVPFMARRERLAAATDPILRNRRLTLRVQRLSVGRDRSCWQPATELGRPDALWIEPLGTWTAGAVHDLIAAAACRLPAKSGSGPYAVSLRASGFSAGCGLYHVLYVLRGRWRVEVHLGYENEIAPAALEVLRGLAAEQ